MVRFALLPRRFRGRHVVLARRVLAAGMFVLALVLALRPSAPTPALAESDAARAGPESVLRAAPGFSLVPIRLADPGIAQFVSPGSRVDVITLDAAARTRKVLAGLASVAAIRPPPEDGRLPGGEGKGPLLLISLPAEVATEVAALSLRSPVTVTLR
ncbi:hypothetical protein FNH05_14360 [Amycolatopsis rhizosphaerae]|uniref:Flp pilus assembly protein RcpC/CpaB domain-containing protein n=1 Tax=Amycolatopsis rhizosphaerae TaxID=2053003 RepID=A0A558CS88_9PSEU|nr:hypothetical protein [Amycolatopsis rhizosphaerae]TVT51630.1 hypothetical protein FNH05_14360 [Amycolatopsis rhizosphaerae]